MHRLWWQLPGPSRFVSQIAEDLRDGRNVVICLPQHAPDGLRGAVRSALEGGEAWSWHTARVDGAMWAEPARALFARFVPDASPSAILNASTLVNEESFAGKIIWLEGIHPGISRAWKEFLMEYQHACRSRSVLDRTLFCVPLAGDLTIDPPTSDVCLSHRHLCGVVGSIDVLLYTSYLLQERTLPCLEKRVVTAVIASLALWDRDVCDRLVAEETKTILQPASVLREIARERGWCVEGGRVPCHSWCSGARDVVDGREKIHSAALAAVGDGRAIERRIWSAEVGVALPFIEERRQEILADLAEVLTVPFTTRFGEVIDDVHDLEIGHIEAQVAAKSRLVHYRTRRLVQRLREMRNCLSHLAPLSAELLLSDDIAEPLGSRRP